MRGLGPRHGRPETLDESDTRERAERYQKGESDRYQRRDSLVHGMTRSPAPNRVDRFGSASSAPLDGAEGRAVPTRGRRAGARRATHPLSAHRARDLSRWALWGPCRPVVAPALSRPGARQLYGGATAPWRTPAAGRGEQPTARTDAAGPPSRTDPEAWNVAPIPESPVRFRPDDSFDAAALSGRRLAHPTTWTIARPDAPFWPSIPPGGLREAPSLASSGSRRRR